MCTMGAVSHGNRQIMMKTLDFAEPGIYSGTFFHSESGQRVIGIGMWGQSGLNAGINESGVGIMMSYFGTNVDNSPPYHGRWHDHRAIYNARALFAARTAEEALNILEQCVRVEGSPVGGTHLMLDSVGTLAVLEHENGQTVTAVYAADEPHSLAYANTAHHGFQSAEELLPDTIRADRLTRERTLARRIQAEILPCSDSEAVIRCCQSILSSHGEEEDEVGSICVHHLNLPGARANLGGVMTTIAGIVLDVHNCSIYYSKGNPCEGRWQALTFDHEA